MKRALIAVVLSAAAVLAVGAIVLPRLWSGSTGSRSSAARPAEVLVLEPADQDLGGVDWGDVASFEIRVRNIGDASVTLASLETSCVCASLRNDAMLTGAVLAPGETASIEGDFAILHAADIARTFVSVRPSSGPSATASVSATPRATHRMNPELIDFGVVDPASAQSQMLSRKFAFESTVDALLGEARTDAPWLRIETLDTGRSTLLARLTVDASALSRGLNSARVCAPTSSTVRPDACLTVRVSLTPSLMLSPTRLVARPGETHRLMLHAPLMLAPVTVSSTGPIEVTQVEPDCIEVAVHPGASQGDAATVSVVAEELGAAESIVEITDFGGEP